MNFTDYDDCTNNNDPIELLCREGEAVGQHEMSREPREVCPGCRDASRLIETDDGYRCGACGGQFAGWEIRGFL